MALKGILQTVLNILFTYYIFPTSFNGLFTYILKFTFFLIILAIVNGIFEEFYNYVSKNYKRFIMRGIDTREDVQVNATANLKRMDWVGYTLYKFYSFKHNYKRELNRFYITILENLFISAVYLLIIGLVLGFLIVANIYY